MKMATPATVSARTTIVLPIAMDGNLEICRIKLGKSKNQVVVQALDEFLRKHGLDPTKVPKSLDVHY